MKTIACFVVVVLLSFINNVLAGPLEDADTAADHGDYRR
jgi:hypothetical protein